MRFPGFFSLAVSTLCGLLLARGGVARAADAPKDDAKGTGGASAGATVGVDASVSGAPKAGEHVEDGDEEAADEGDEHTQPEPREPAEAEKDGKKEHKREHEEEAGVTVGLDLVLGWGNVPFVVPTTTNTTSAPQAATFSRQDQTSSNVQSFVLSAGVELSRHVGIGIRAPLTFATFNPDGAPSRSTAGVGNVELEGEYAGSVAHGLRLVGALGIALPTAEGNEIPDTLVNAPVASIDQAQLDRSSMAKAAAYARGYEDNALFEPNRFGIVPKIGLLYRTHGLSLEPTIKVENLIGTSSGLANGYIGELVGALRVGYWIHKEFELAVRGWFNAGFAGGDEDKKTSATIEPQVVLRFGPVRPYAGLLVPLAGPPKDNGFIGARIGVTAGF